MTAIHVARSSSAPQLESWRSNPRPRRRLIVDPFDVAASAISLTRIWRESVPEQPNQDSPGTIAIASLSKPVAELRAMGALDASTATDVTRILDRIASAGFTRVLITCADVTFIDSSGLRSLLSAAPRIERAGGHLAFVDPSRAVAKALLVCDPAKLTSPDQPDDLGHGTSGTLLDSSPASPLSNRRVPGRGTPRQAPKRTSRPRATTAS